MKKVIQTAIIGYGLSGRYFHAPFLYVHPGFKVLKVLERKGETAKELLPKVDIVRDLESIINDPKIELVVIATPNNFHYSMAKDCLQIGKHVVIEKPFTLNSKDADELIALADKKKLKIFVYHNRRWDGDFLTIRKLLKSGALGEVSEFEAHFDRYRPKLTTRIWREDEKNGGGVLYDLGPHLIDQALHLFGIPDKLMAEIESQRKTSMVDDYFRLTLFYKKMKAILTAGMLVKDPGPRYIIHGTIGSFVKYGIDPQEEELRKGALPASEDWGAEDPDKWGLITIDYADMNIHGSVETEPGNYMEFYNNVHDVLTKKLSLAVKPADARNVIRIIEFARESSIKKKEVKVKLLPVN
jgi:scyllo-inositol 2-dehydrogenase (NADP+)